jgi:hypothetical protein
MKHQIEIPNDLAADTKMLVLDFAEALALKLHAAEIKYGYDNGWMRKAWIEKGICQQRLIDHIQKGDPRDVAAYCAFLWYHQASTKPHERP